MGIDVFKLNCRTSEIQPKAEELSVQGTGSRHRHSEIKIEFQPEINADPSSYP